MGGLSMVRWLRPAPARRQQRESLHDFIAARMDPATGKLPEDGVDLLDEQPTTPSGIRFAPGAMDGIGVHHATFDGEAKDGHAVARRLIRIARLGHPADMDEFETFV